MSERASDTWATFRIDGQLFALRVAVVQEVLASLPLTRVPLAPGHVVGLLNLRGRVLSAVEGRALLGVTPRSGTQAPFIVVVAAGGHFAALLVDEVGDVLELPEAGWRPVPATLSKEQRSLVGGVQALAEGNVLSLDVARVLDEERSN